MASRKLVRLSMPKPRPKMSEEGKRLSTWMMWPTNAKFFSRRVSVVRFWGQWSCHQNVNQRTKSNDETRVQNPQSCSWLAVQLADSQNKGSFPRDEWNHLLCLFNIMNFSLYSCSHFSDFLSGDQVRKRSAMSKRAQEATSSEGFPVAKTKAYGAGKGETHHSADARVWDLWSTRGIPMKGKKQK